ncbi:MAG: hypothetical protein M3Y83_08280 [Actinomycetota bacterium]|nr:hypothetical protein [Actinomycetota bacterium]
MSAHFPGSRSEADKQRGLLPAVSIDGGQVSIDDVVVLPGNWIERHGVTIEAIAPHEAHRLTISLLVSDITVHDEALPQIRVLPTESDH